VALIDQVRCQHTPEVAHVINAMLENRLIRYVDNENGVYLFTPTGPLKIFGLRIAHISGFDMDDAFKGVPNSTMVGTAPPVFLEIDVAASAGELRAKALSAGLVEAVLGQHKRGFQVLKDGYGSYLAPKNRMEMSTIHCGT
jgi:hypothetical protein